MSTVVLISRSYPTAISPIALLAYSCHLLAVISASLVPLSWDFNLSFSSHNDWQHTFRCLIFARSSSDAVLLACDVELVACGAVVSVDVVCMMCA